MNFLLSEATATKLDQVIERLHAEGKIPAATIPCGAKLGLKMLLSAYSVDNDGKLIARKVQDGVSLRKAEL